MMGFWDLLEVSSMPVLQVMLIGLVGAFLASGYSNALTGDTRKHMNKVVYLVFTPFLTFASLAKTVTLGDIISWWFMPVNIGVIFLIGGTLGWVAVKVVRPERHLGGLIIATSSAGTQGIVSLSLSLSVCANLRDLLLHLPMAMFIILQLKFLHCPFNRQLGQPDADCAPSDIISHGYVHNPTTLQMLILSYIARLGIPSLAATVGCRMPPCPWHYSLMKNSGLLHKKMRTADDAVPGTSNGVVDGINGWVNPKSDDGIEKDLEAPLLPSTSQGYGSATTEQIKVIITQSFSSGKLKDNKLNFLERARESIVQLVEELMTPPTVAAILGFIFGATLWLKSLIIGAAAPLRVVQDSIKLLGDGTILCITLILGGNLTQGIWKSRLKFSVILAVLFLKYTIIPASGHAVIKVAGKLGFLPQDPLYRYTFLLQYALPPAMNIGTMAELFDVAREECSVLFLWTYLVCALALTIWSTIYMWFLS